MRFLNHITLTLKTCFLITIFLLYNPPNWITGSNNVNIWPSCFPEVITSLLCDWCLTLGTVSFRPHITLPLFPLNRVGIQEKNTHLCKMRPVRIFTHSVSFYLFEVSFSFCLVKLERDEEPFFDSKYSLF